MLDPVKMRPAPLSHFQTKTQDEVKTLMKNYEGFKSAPLSCHTKIGDLRLKFSWIL